MINKNNLNNYLELKNFEEELRLDLNNSMSFHWSNWQETCNLKIKNGDTAEVDRSIALYKSIPIWLLLGNKKIKSNLLELYHHYLNDQGEQTKSSFYLSIGKEQGPYINFSSLAWLNNNILRNVVFFKISKSEIRKRQFRLNWESNPLVKLDSFYHSGVDLRTHAITEQGIIFKVLGKSNFERILNAKQLIIHLNINPFLRSVRVFQDDFLKSVASEDFSLHDLKNLHSFIIKPKNIITNVKEIKAQDAQSYHFFVAFDHIESDQINFFIETPLRRFLLNTKECFELQLVA
jgi:hypothetical protein